MFIGARFAETGTDLHVICRHIGQQNAFLFQRSLANQSFAQLEAMSSRLCRSRLA